jgi:predicted Holliday junction resolvase-like endonuclease
MKKVMAMVAVVVAVAFLGVGLAEAQQCSSMMKQVKDGTAKMTDAKKKAEVDKLLAEAQKLNDSGKDADCVKKSDEAAKTAGIKLEKKM